MTQRGIYILGNDKVLKFLKALLFSIKENSPELPICLIPYDDNLHQTRPLCQRYGVSILQDPCYSALETMALDIWASSSYPTHQRLFRKFACFWGPFDEFLFLDADICLLSDVSPLFSIFAKSSLSFVCFDTDHERVYNAGPFRDRMISEYDSIGFNSGHFFSRKGVFNFDQLVKCSSAANKVSENFQDRADQGFMNYAIDTLRISKAPFVKLASNVAEKQWCCQKVRRKGNIYQVHRTSESVAQAQMYLVHWSGFHQPTPKMPMAWCYYNNLAEGQVARAAWHFISDTSSILAKIFLGYKDSLQIRLGGLRKRFL